MDWEVHDHSLVVDPRTIETIIQGRDPTSGDYWELATTFFTFTWTTARSGGKTKPATTPIRKTANSRSTLPVA